MKAFILTAGTGSRLQPLSYDTPKPMLPILNRPVLGHIVDHLSQQGVSDIMMNPGFLGHQIEQYFGDGYQFGVSISYLPEFLTFDGKQSYCIRGSASSLAVADQNFGFFDEPVFVICGDAIIDLNMQDAMEQHIRSGADASVILQKVNPSEANQYGIAQLTSDNFISHFIEKPKTVPDSPCFANTGIYIFNPEVIAGITQMDGFDIGQDLIPMLIAKGKQVLGQKPNFNWHDIGTLSDYISVNHLLNKQFNQGLPSGTTQVSHLNIGANCQLAQSLSDIKGQLTLGNGCIVEKGVRFSGSVVLGNNCVVGAGTTIKNSVIHSYCQIPNNSVLENVILTDKWLVMFDAAGKIKKKIQLNSGDSRAYYQLGTVKTGQQLSA